MRLCGKNGLIQRRDRCLASVSLRFGLVVADEDVCLRRSFEGPCSACSDWPEQAEHFYIDTDVPRLWPDVSGVPGAVDLLGGTMDIPVESSPA